MTFPTSARPAARPRSTRARGAVLCLALLLPWAAVGGQDAPGPWSRERARAWYDALPWLVGCNFAPSNAINQLEMWQAETFDPETIDRELGWAAGLGFTSVRVFLHDLLWQAGSGAFLDRIDRFLAIADKHRIGVMLVLFDAVWDPFPKLGKQRDPKPHLHNSGWVQGPGAEILKDLSRHDSLKPYVQGVVRRFKDDRRVHCWDVFNEPDNTNGSSYGKDEPPNKHDLSLALLKKACAWIREVQPSQPLTVGVWIGDWSPEKLSPIAKFMLEQSDVISFHSYAPLEETKARVQLLKAYGRPILCTEYMARPPGSTFEAILPYFKEERIGAYNWGFVAGKTQTIYPWETWRKTYTAEPEVWFHDIFRKDGSVYDAREVELIRKLTGKTKQAGAWPEFRGPTGQGRSTARGVPARWSRDEGIVWRRALDGRGWSSPVIQEDRIHVTAARERSAGGEGGLSLRALALDAATGDVAWDREVFAVSEPLSAHTKNTHASSTPLLADGRLYVHFGAYGTAALSLEGELLWTSRELAYHPVHGNGSSPIAAGRALIVTCDGREEPFLAALERETGKVLWKTPRGVDARKSFSFCTPLLIEVDGRQEIISPASDLVAAYDPATGQELWRVRYEGYSVVPRPVHGHGLVFISTGFDSPVVYAIRPGGQGDVTDTHVAWTMRAGAPNTPSMLLVGDELYMVSDRGVGTCVDARTGEVHWKERLGSGTSSSPILADDKIYVFDEEGRGVVFRPGTKLEIIAENDLGDRVLASPAAIDGALIVRTESALLRIGDRKVAGRGQ